MKKELAIILILICVIVSGCYFGDKVYGSKYKISFKEVSDEVTLYSEFNDPNNTINLVDIAIKEKEFQGIKAISKNLKWEVNIYEIRESNINCGELWLEQDQEYIFIRFNSWNPGPYEGYEIKKTKLYEKSLIDELKQQECLKIEKVE